MSLYKIFIPLRKVFTSYLWPAAYLCFAQKAMSEQFSHKISLTRQYIYSIALVLTASAICYGLQAYLGYKVVAFILLLCVSLVAVSFDIFPVLIAAILSALIWDFFFIPPTFTFRVQDPDDGILLLMYFVIAMINGVLTYKIRKAQKEARKKIERENIVRLYNTFLNSLSHELRTPIATIIGATDNLLATNSNLTQLNRHDLVAEIAKASFRLNQQVENLLNISRLESGFLQPKYDWADISEVIYNVVQRVEENKISQKIVINIDPGLPLFKLDKGMLEQVVYNLVNNAVQYTPSGSKIDIAANDHGNLLQLTVEDNGKGFPVGEKEMVFDKFYRLKHSKPGGTGLGLSIVKGFTEAMKGSIYLENVPAGGAKFTVCIPAATSHLKALKHD